MLEIQEETRVPSHLSITTITSTFSLGTVIDIQDLRERIKRRSPFKIREKESSSQCEWTLKENRFFNQITVEYRDKYSKKSIKIFPNGSVHVTGCPTTIDCARVMSQVALFIKTYMDKTVTPTNLNIRMINANFSMNSILNLNKVTTIFENKRCTVSFKPEIYSAVRIKFVPPEPGMKKITASVFSSGCVLITGAQNLREIIASYKFLIDSLQEACVRPNMTTKSFDSFMGVKFESWKKHLLGTM